MKRLVLAVVRTGVRTGLRTVVPTVARRVVPTVAILVGLLGVGIVVALPEEGHTGGAALSSQERPVRLEYIAHAAFVIESPGGTRIVIDPYNGNIWLGYAFPEGIEADLVAVSIRTTITTPPTISATLRRSCGPRGSFASAM